VVLTVVETTVKPGRENWFSEFREYYRRSGLAYIVVISYAHMYVLGLWAIVMPIVIVGLRLYFI